MAVTAIQDLNIKIFADGADLDGIARLAQDPLIKGFTTNPTLMAKANGAVDYREFAEQVLEAVNGKPVSFEVFSDDFDEMERQARLISSWAENIYTKVPVTNTQGESSGDLIRRLARDGLKLNVTALMTPAQARDVAARLEGGPPSIISIFAGRVADTGRDPVPLMAEAVDALAAYPNVELLWASPREILNIVQADAVGCDIVTVTHDLLAKLPTLGKDLDEFSLDTVKMFHDSARSAAFAL
jgi:transaldolase